MKEKFKLVKKLRGYAISSISDPIVKVAMRILARKVKRKCFIDEVPKSVIIRVAQCAEGV